MAERKIGIVYDPAYLKHDTGPEHPETAARLLVIEEAIKSIGDCGVKIPARPATRDELLLVHTPEYVDHILNLQINERVTLEMDTVASKDTPDAALKAVGGVLAAVDCAIEGNLSRAFCAVRPPGHHAEPEKAMGFCIFNNVAIGAAYALQKYFLNRIAIVDWDLHHGNGTQDAFYKSDQVLYISLHQSPFYPGTGTVDEIGTGPGAGFTINIPMVAGCSDQDFREAFAEIVIPALRNYKPEMLFISAGFDSHQDDPLGSLYLTSPYFGEMTRNLVEIAEEFCYGRLISVLEGGYGRKVLKESVEYHLKELCK
jgi:acetoin utilization deacetylase AcuC-like enzyme